LADGRERKKFGVSGGKRRKEEEKKAEAAR
jgi:hypothetical protein